MARTKTTRRKSSSKRTSISNRRSGVIKPKLGQALRKHAQDVIEKRVQRMDRKFGKIPIMSKETLDDFDALIYSTLMDSVEKKPYSKRFVWPVFKREAESKAFALDISVFKSRDMTKYLQDFFAQVKQWLESVDALMLDDEHYEHYQKRVVCIANHLKTLWDNHKSDVDTFLKHSRVSNRVLLVWDWSNAK